MRRCLTWLFVLPVVIVGSQVAHGVAYWWAYPQAGVRLAALARSGHGYLAYAPAALGLLGAVQAIAFILVVLDKVRGRPARGFPPLAFLLVPELGFVLQEYLERLLALGVFPWWTALEPSFWRGVVLQVPLGVAAYLIAAALLRTASVVADVVTARAEPQAVAPRGPTGSWRPPVVFLPRPAPLAALAADRAPPVFAH